MKRILLSAAVLVFFCAGSAWGGDLSLFTEEYPPYNYTKEGKVQGVNTRLLLRAADRAGLDLTREDISVLPWARAYNTALNNADTCVYTTMRTPKREPHFRWIGPLVNTEKVLMSAGNSRLEIHSVKEVRRYTVGVVIDDVCRDILRNKGVPEEKIEPAPSALSNLRKLVRGRVDLVAYDELTLRYVAKENGINPDSLHSEHVLGKGDHYLACNPDTNATALRRLQEALEKLRRQAGE